MALSPMRTSYWARPSSIPIAKKSFRCARSRSSTRTATPRTIANATPPAAGCTSSARSIPICPSSSSRTLESANAPHLQDLRDANVHYIIGVKPGDHKFLFERLHDADEAGRTQTLSLVDEDTGIVHHL